MATFKTSVASSIFVASFLSIVLGQQLSIQFTILEEQPPITYIGNIAEQSKIRTNLTDSEIVRLRYQILTKGNPYANLFLVNEVTGRFESNSKLDREKLCSRTLSCVLSIDVAVFMQDEANINNPSDLYRVIQVAIEIDDLNDNSPTFPQGVISLELPESSSVGSEILTGTAKDEDSGHQNFVQTYAILNSDGTFRLKTLKNTVGEANFAIILNKTVDREVKDLYQITIVATDGGSPAKSGSVVVDISITDINDHKPVFTKSPYNITLQENEPMGLVVLTVLAKDADSGENGRVTYAFSSGTKRRVLDVFLLNATTGEIRLQKALDYEREQIFSIVVEAHDHGQPAEVTQVMVNINILDVNDNAPQININLPPGGADVSENATAGWYIANVVVSDADNGGTGSLTCNIESEKFTLIKFSREIYKVNLKMPLDREEQEVHNVSVVCFDDGVPRKTNRTFFTINVDDINDNSPVFKQNRYTAAIKENNSVGDIIFVVHADDKDSGENGRVSYKLLDYTELFSINELTGVISANVVFDRENLTDVSVRVVASDNGMPQRATTATVAVKIRDVNDGTPRFDRDFYSFNVQENQHTTTVLGNVSANDTDIGKNGAFEFSVETNFAHFFNVDEYGNIRSKIILDREIVSQYSFKIYVTDKGIPPKSSSAHVTINVQDENDNVPVIYYPSSKNNTLHLRLNTIRQSVITNVIANDSDQGVNSHLTYSVIQGNVNSMFKINNSTGQITLNKDLVENDAGTYTLVLAVQDGGVPQRATWTNLVLVVGSQTDAKNLIIVIAVCSVTLFIAFALIITICVIRRHDNKLFQERRVHFEKTRKPYLMECFKGLSSPSNNNNNNNNNIKGERIKNINIQANQKLDADTKPIVPGSEDSSTSDDSITKKQSHGMKIELTRSDSGIAELSGGSTSPPQSYRGDFNDNHEPEIDLTSSYPGTFTFVDNNVRQYSSNAVDSQLPQNTQSEWQKNERAQIPLAAQYQRYVSMDENILNKNKPKIVFARFRSISESQSAEFLNDGVDTESVSISHSNSFKHANDVHNLNKSYSGPFYLTNSLERPSRSHYAYPRTHLAHNQSRPATRRELPTIRATPEPLYDPLQELNAISYQDNQNVTAHSPGGRNNINERQLQTQFSFDHPSSPYDLRNDEKMFNRDVIV